MAKLDRKAEELLDNMTPKQRLFALEYMKTNDICTSYSKCYKVSNDTIARKRGWQLLSESPELIAFFAHTQAQLAQKYQMTLEDVIDKHMLIVKSYEELLSLATSPEPLTPEQNTKFLNLKDIIKTSDFRNSMIEISKLKQQYKNEIDFTTTNTKIINIQISSTPLQDIEDVDFTSIEPAPDDTGLDRAQED
jgi:hypothetical protein